MPTTRVSADAVNAWVIRPAGFVKLMTHASGARRRTLATRSVKTGMVRRAIAQPPGPVVSCPTTPYASGTCSSMIRPARPPTRTLVITNDAPSNAPAGEVAVWRAKGRPLRTSSASASVLTRCSASGSVSYSTTRSTARRARRSISPEIISGVRIPPPPTTATITATPPGAPGPGLAGRRPRQLPRRADGLSGIGPRREPLGVALRWHEARHPFHNLPKPRVGVHLRIPADVQGRRNLLAAQLLQQLHMRFKWRSHPGEVHMTGGRPLPCPEQLPGLARASFVGEEAAVSGRREGHRDR